MENFVDIWQYMPHGMCLLWQPWLVVLWAGSDFLIFLAYMAIPFSLFRIARARTDLKQRGVVLLFVAFILLCGLTHLLGVVTLWWPIYPFVGLVKLATGLVSAVTAIILVRLVPTLIALPSHAELEDVNRRLRQKIAEHEAAEAELRAIRDQLEEKVAERTEELSQANARMAVVAREAVHRSKNLLTVVGSIARQSARGQDQIGDYLSTLLGRIDALAVATQTVIGGQETTSADFRDVVENQIRPLRMTIDDRIKVDGPPVSVSSEAAQQIGLAIHELATNTQKYSRLLESDGEISVTWHHEGAGPDRELVFEWSEPQAGNTQSESAGRTGFGHTLLTRIVPAMLRGSASHGIENGDLVYRLRVPADAFVADATAAGDIAMAARIVDADFGIA